MMVSTKGRYALRVMIDLAENNTRDYIPLKDIARRQEISQKYLESIMTVLSKAGLVDALHGKGGGYRLNRAPAEYTVAELLELTEGSLAPVACLEGERNECQRAASCRTLAMWTKLDQVIRDYLQSVTLKDLVGTEVPGDYVI